MQTALGNQPPPVNGSNQFPAPMGGMYEHDAPDPKLATAVDSTKIEDPAVIVDQQDAALRNSHVRGI